ncbi:AAA family ATPase [Bradyrhizobium pachyrhizi]|uniref:AAA family ATPase n=1 Tax=Bradyrhizobium pachyrhizi TaxID=280333 RepID=UPI0018F8C946|nr:AAA family ATPase [Bradyrhizobium pachyrhizi]
MALENFSLYTIQPNVEVRLVRDVFCLMGANGLGKSTFLNTLNFGITGAVPDPDRKFLSASEYFVETSRLDRIEDYFSGRISEELRSVASVTVELEWTSTTIVVKRNIFSGSKVASFAITDRADGSTRTVTEVDAEDAGVPQKRYEDEMRRLTGVADFAQFVFLFHFVNTFDEGRHLLMWDRNALTNALYLAFGADPAAAKIADKLQHDMKREDSRARNVRFSARHVTSRIDQLVKLIDKAEPGDEETLDALQKHNLLLQDRHAAAESRLRNKQSERRDADVKRIDLNARLTELQIEYRRLFSSRVQQAGSVSHHPAIRATLTEDRCAVCGTHHTAALVQAKLDAGHCPLCDSVLNASEDDSDAVQGLRYIDGKIIALQEELKTISAVSQRLGSELSMAEAEEAAAQQSLAEFLEGNGERISAGQAGEFSAVKKEIAKLEKERDEFRDLSAKHYAKRDELREKLRGYETTLKQHYERGSLEFVPRFRDLAEEFIGLPIDVELEHQQGNAAGFGLKLSMAGVLRLRSDEVSESQRFFIDIALRMALAEHMSDGPATLLIDTPEGSLDIAYEARAGSMFSKFAEAGNKILMTANIKSSELVLNLAKLRKHQGMQVVRMTDWTDLSEVQQSGEQLFLAAYSDIEAALN